MRTRPDDAGPREPDFPEQCPSCGADNIDGDGELLDESYLTCGRLECIEVQKKLEAQDRAADDAAAAEWRRENLPRCPDCGCTWSECACVSGPGAGTP